VLEAARHCVSSPTVLLTSSAEVYGAVQPGDLPLTEDSPLLPVSPYAASKVAAEYLGVQAHLGQHTPVVRARAFNHVGPGQSPAFVVSALAKRIVEAERAGSKELSVGNLRPRRDFTDVRDVVRAYRLLVLHGEAGEVYNVCSGEDVAIEDVAGRLLAIAGTDLELVVDSSLERPADVPVLRGDASRLRSATGWRPEIPLDTTLRAILEHWRTALE
jgi:GDP-4-dehydro-6-deoxy-D-mannose reductase